MGISGLSENLTQSQQRPLEDDDPHFLPYPGISMMLTDSL